METTITWTLFWKHAVIAFFGAIVNAANAHRMGTSKGFLDFFLLTLMSSFSGVMFALIAIYLFNNEYVTLAAAGAGGYLGVEGLTVLTGNIRDFISNILSKKE